jgi:hypothetical protein
MAKTPYPMPKQGTPSKLGTGSKAAPSVKSPKPVKKGSAGQSYPGVHQQTHSS